MTRPFAALLVALACLPAAALAEPNLLIAEIHYHPPGPGEELEFIEILNPEPPRVDIGGWRLAGDVECWFPAGLVLLPGARLVVARAPALLQRAYGLEETPLAFCGRLKNGSGDVRLVNPMGVVACRVRYADGFPWPSSPDGTGHSLSLVDPFLDASDPASWRASPSVGGTPGKDNGLTKGYGQPLPEPEPRVRINEVCAGPKGFVELFNASPTPADLEGFFLSDAYEDLKRTVFPKGVVVAPWGRVVLDRAVLGEGFVLEGKVLEVALAAPGADRVVDAVRLSGLAAGSAAGRVPDGSATFRSLARPTPALANLAPETADLLFSEIMYHPVTEEEADEYVEILNRSAAAVALQGYRIEGGIRLVFPKGASIAPGGTVVAAKDPSRVSGTYGVSRAAVFGPFEGTLSDSGERLALVDREGNLVDEVTYADGDPWPMWADGLGSSLELIHPATGNDLPAAWGASRCGRDARWTTYVYSGAHRKVRDKSYSEFQFLLLDEGECLIDSVQLVTTEERLVAEGFERGDEGWTAVGTHDRSGLSPDPDNPKKACYRLVAEGGGDPRNNYVSVKVPREMEEGKIYYLKFRARWVKGSVQLLTRSVGHGVAQVHLLEPPARTGTPGAANSVAEERPRPAVAEPEQAPIAPAPDEPVVFTVRVDGPVDGVTLVGRADGRDGWTRYPMNRKGAPAPPGSTLWEAAMAVPGAGLVEYFVEARRGDDVGLYPRDAPVNTLLFLVGLKLHERLPTYHLLITQAHWRAMAESPRTSNRYVPATFVYGTGYAYHHAGFRRRGSPYHRPEDLAKNVDWKIRFGGARFAGKSSMAIDRKTQDRHQNERTVHWLLTHVRTPGIRQRYVWFNLFGRQEGVCEDVERVSGSFVDRWFPGGERGNLHKLDAYWEIGDEHQARGQAAYFRFLGTSPEPYRWNFPPRARGNVEDFGPLIKLIALMDPQTTPDGPFLAQVEKDVNVDQWLRAFAVRTIADDWDTMGLAGGKNAFVYRSPGKEGLWHLLVWDSDLTFRRPTSPLFSDRFPSFKRLLEQKAVRRQFFSYLAFLATGPLAPETIEPVVRDNAAVCGFDPANLVNFAKGRGPFVLGQVPPGPAFGVKSVKRIPGNRDEPDFVRVTGSAPTLVSRLTLGGVPGTFRMVDDRFFVAEIPVGPEGGMLTLSAEDYGGTPLDRREIRVPARRSAPELEKAPVPDPPLQAEAAAAPRPTRTLSIGEGAKPPAEETPAPQPSAAATEAKDPAPAPGPEAKDPAADPLAPPQAPGPSPPPAVDPDEPPPTVADAAAPFESSRPTRSGPVALVPRSFRPGPDTASTPEPAGEDDAWVREGARETAESPSGGSSTASIARLLGLLVGGALLGVFAAALFLRRRAKPQPLSPYPAGWTPTPAVSPVPPPVRPPPPAEPAPAPFADARSAPAPEPEDLPPWIPEGAPPDAAAHDTLPPWIPEALPPADVPPPAADPHVTPPMGTPAPESAAHDTLPPWIPEEPPPSAEAPPARPADEPAAPPEEEPPAEPPPPESLQDKLRGDIEVLAGEDYHAAAHSFMRLCQMGEEALPALLEAYGREGATPFGRVRDGAMGLFPERAGEGNPPMTLRDVLQVLVRAAKGLACGDEGPSPS